MAPTLTVGLSNYNHAQFLPEALDGILSQSRQPDELIVIDDASTDNSMQILADYAARYPLIRLIANTRNCGANANIGMLLSLAKCRYFYSAGADDAILPGFLEKSMAALASHPAAGLCSTLSRVIDREGADEGVLFEDPFCHRQQTYYFSSTEVRRHFLRQTPWFQGNTVIYRKDVLAAAGGFRPELGPFSDGFAQQVIALTHGVCFVPEPLAAWRRMATSFSAQISSNPVEALRIREQAHAYMVGEYKVIFPPAYVVRWKNRCDYEHLMIYFQPTFAEGRRRLQEPLASGRGRSRFVLRAALTSLAAAQLAVELLAACLFRWFDLPQFAKNKVRRALSR